jgi:hypothetical protein
MAKHTRDQALSAIKHFTNVVNVVNRQLEVVNRIHRENELDEERANAQDQLDMWNQVLRGLGPEHSFDILFKACCAFPELEAHFDARLNTLRGNKGYALNAKITTKDLFIHRFGQEIQRLLDLARS